MAPSFNQPEILIPIGFLIGILISKVTRYALAVCALGAVIAGALVLLGKGELLAQNADIAPKVIALSSEIIGVLKSFLRSSPWLLAGALVGMLVRELIGLFQRI